MYYFLRVTIFYNASLSKLRNKNISTSYKIIALLETEEIRGMDN